MLNGRQQLASFRKSGSWLRSQSGRLLSGLGLAASSPWVADAARKDKNRGDDRDRKDDDARDDRSSRRDDNREDRNANRDKSADTRSENQDASDKSDKRDRSERRNEDNGDRNGSGDGSRREESRRQDTGAESDEASSSSDAVTEDSGGGGRRTRELEQRADDVPADDEPATTRVTPANPNAVLDDIPETSIADLVVEANEDVIATVSARGGFAFARSGGVTAVTGPDGATIIQTGETDTGTTPRPAPDEPSDDGGNNDMDFAS